jgi:alkylation response protein AidB-like acyl-CoA dehydrogenase
MTTQVVPVSSSLQSFTGPEAEDFRETVRYRLAPAIPDGWEEAKELTENHPEALELRRQWDRKRTEAGYPVIFWPREYGGNGFGPIEQVLFHEVWGELEAPQPLNLLGYTLAGRALIDWGTTAQKEGFLPRILSGEDLWCEGFSEPNGGADMAAVQTRGTKTASGWHIEGQKIWTSFSPRADRMYCLTKTSPTAPRHHNLSVFMLDMHLPGVHVEPIRDITGIAEFGQVFIDVEVPDDVRLGAEGEGWTLSSIVGANRQRGEGAAAFATRAAEVGAWLRRLRHCAKAGRRGGGSGVAARLDEIAVRVEGYRWQVRRAVAQAMRGREAFAAQSIMKIYSTELIQQMTEFALELECDEHERYWRSRHLDFRKLTIAGGPNEIYRNVVANRVLGMGRG